MPVIVRKHKPYSKITLRFLKSRGNPRLDELKIYSCSLIITSQQIKLNLYLFQETSKIYNIQNLPNSDLIQIALSQFQSIIF